MAQQQNVGIGGQSQASSHSGGWAGSPSAAVWDQTTRNIVDSMDGAPPDFGSGRSAEWEVKNGAWEWDQVGPMYPARHLDVHPSAIAFASGGQTVASPGTHGALVLKNDGVLHDNSDPSRVGIPTSVEQHTPIQVSILSSDQQRRLALELGEGGSSNERRKSNVQEFGNASLVSVAPAAGGISAAAAAAGTELNLKLGRNVYYEENQTGRGAGSAPPASASPAPATASASAASAQAVYAVCPPGKKQRVQSPNVQVCQVDGCKQDLSGSKEYHKRHKVCEHHSKAPRVIVAGDMEQRFCQQCSRFHGLSEFDEGKRSCRRRLAGHNERRRKPPPEQASIASSGNSSSVFQGEAGGHGGNVSTEERKRSNSGLAEQHACFIPMQRTPGSSSTSVESDDQSGSLGTNFKLNHGKASPWAVLGRGDETTGLACQPPVTMSERQPSYLSPASERVLMFFQSPNGAIAGPGVHHFPAEGAAGSMGPGLTLASSSGPAGVLAGLDRPVSQHVSGILDSGRALSLLTSHARGSRGAGASGSMPLAVSAAQSDVTLEQLISEEARNAFSPRGTQSRFPGSLSGSADKLFRQAPREMQLSNLNRGGDTSTREQQQQHRNVVPGLGMVGGYDSHGHSMLSIMHGQPEFRALQAPSSSQRPTIDLMQPPAHNQFPEFSALRPFEGSLFDSQQMM